MAKNTFLQLAAYVAIAAIALCVAIAAILAGPHLVVVVISFTTGLYGMREIGRIWNDPDLVSRHY